MAQGRLLRTTIATSEQLADMPERHELLFLRAVPHLDREGRILGDPRRLLAQIAPLRGYAPADMAAAIISWIESNMVAAYTDEQGQRVLWFEGFERSQSGTAWKKKETASKFGSPPTTWRGVIPEWLRLPPAVSMPPPAISGGTDASSEHHVTPAISGGVHAAAAQLNRKEEKGNEVKARARAQGTNPPLHTVHDDSVDPRVADLEHAIRAERTFADLDVQELADMTLSVMDSHGVTLDEALRGIRDCGAEGQSQRAAGPKHAWNAGTAASMLRRYVGAIPKNRHRHRAGGPDPIQPATEVTIHRDNRTVGPMHLPILDGPAPPHRAAPAGPATPADVTAAVANASRRKP